MGNIQSTKMYSKFLKKSILFCGLTFLMLGCNTAHATELYFSYYSDGSTGSEIAVQDATFSVPTGATLYVAVKGGRYAPNGDDVIGWQLNDYNSNPVDCKSATTTLSAWGFPVIDDIDSTDGMSFVVIPLTGTACNQSYSNFNGVFIDEIAGYVSDAEFFSYEGEGTYTSPISIADNASDISFAADETKFISLDPSNMEVVATSTSNTLYADLYVHDDDYEEGMFVRLLYVRQADLQAAVANQSLLWTSLDLNDTITSGYNFLATTTGDLGDEGTYYYKAELRRQSSWWSTALSYVNPFSSLDPDVVVSTSTTFVYGEMTSFDTFVSSTTQAINDFYASSTLSIEDAKAACSFSTSFSLTDCFGFIFGWQEGSMDTAFSNIKNNLLSYAPFGYITRFLEIAAGGETTELPTIDYTFGSNTPLQGQRIALNPWQYLSFTATGTPLHDIKSDVVGEEKNVWEIFEPFYNFVVYLCLAILIIGDILGIAVGGGSSYMARKRGEGSSGNRNPSSYREWLYNHRK